VTARTRRRPGPAADQGYSLVELAVAMGIMSIVMIISFGAMLQIYSATSRTESTSFARDQLSNAFRRLDKELRYANWVAAPGQVNNRWYLEYAVAGGCRQLVLDDDVLTLASWKPPATTPGAPTAIAGELAVPAGTPPFTVYSPGAQPFASSSPGAGGVGKLYAPEYSQVRLRFTATVGTVTLPFDTVFTALNTSRNTSPTNDCGNGRPTA
jgi:prepilin-type N-terminal cleavage/methylation domain-containing protein